MRWVGIAGPVNSADSFARVDDDVASGGKEQAVKSDKTAQYSNANGSSRADGADGWHRTPHPNAATRLLGLRWPMDGASRKITGHAEPIKAEPAPLAENKNPRNPSATTDRLGLMVCSALFTCHTHRPLPMMPRVLLLDAAVFLTMSLLVFETAMFASVNLSYRKQRPAIHNLSVHNDGTRPEGVIAKLYGDIIHHFQTLQTNAERPVTAK